MFHESCTESSHDLSPMKGILFSDMCLKLLSDSFKEEEAFDIPLSLEEKRISYDYQSKLRSFGLDFEFSARQTCMEFDEDEHVETYLRVTHVPKCFALREENELKYNRSFSMAEMTATLINDVIDKIKSTRGGGLGILPKSINDVLNSRACRGAVKFGDKLSLEKCESLLKELGNCKAPFQCAHGRPSLAPIIELEKVRMCMKRSKLKPKLNLAKLRMC